MKPYRPNPGAATYHEIAAELGVSHTRVMQIEQQALAKLRRFAHLEDFRPEDPPVDQTIYILDPY